MKMLVALFIHVRGPFWIILFGNPPLRQNVIWKPFGRRIKGGMSQRIAAQMRKNIYNQAAWVLLLACALNDMQQGVHLCKRIYKNL